MSVCGGLLSSKGDDVDVDPEGHKREDFRLSLRILYPRSYARRHQKEGTTRPYDPRLCFWLDREQTEMRCSSRALAANHAMMGKMREN